MLYLRPNGVLPIMSDIKYIHGVKVHNTTAAESFIPILLDYIQPESVVDIGCGLGTWLKVFSKFGVKEILGIDGSNVDKFLLTIPVENFLEHDLRKPLNLNRRFDLAICLEVAEHLPNESADNLIDILAAASDNILFSAALPMQGGQNHINEQSFSYWVEKFNHKGYEVKDLFRAVIWDNVQIDWWYRQNMFLVSKVEHLQQKKIQDYYHPQRVSDIVYENNSCAVKLESITEEYRGVHAGRISSLKALKIFLKSLLRAST